MQMLSSRGAPLLCCLLAALLLSGCGVSTQPNDYTLPGQPGVGDDGYPVTVRFETVENLVPNSAVKIDNVTVGTVASVSAENWTAEVTLRLKDSVRVPDDATFSIAQKTLLGAQYVEISTRADPARSGTSTAAASREADAGGEQQASTAGSDAPVLQPGAVVGVEQTGSYPVTEQVLGSVALLLNNGGLSQISTITRELSTTLQGRVPDTQQLIQRTNRLLTTLDRDKQTIVSTLQGLDRLSRRLSQNKDVVARAIDRITPGVAALNEERGNLVRAVTSTGRTSTRAQQVIEVNQEALLSNLEQLRPTLERLSTVADSLPEALKLGLTIPFPAMTTTEAIHGDYANLFVKLNLSPRTLADSFLGSSQPDTALQDANPLTGPLSLGQQQEKNQDSEQDASPTTKPSRAPERSPDRDSPSPSPPATQEPTPDQDGGGAGSDGGSQGSGDSCVLGLIGDC